MALATLTEVKAALNISDTDSDAQITALLEPISALIEREAGRRFASETITECHTGGDPTIALREFPVASITSVTDKVTGETLASTGYDLKSDTGLLRRLPLGAQWATAGFDQVVYRLENPSVYRWEIVYVGGPATVPEDIKFALYLSIAASLDRGAATGGGGGVGGIIAEKDGDYSYQRAATASAGSAALSASGLTAQSAAIARGYRAGVFI